MCVPCFQNREILMRKAVNISESKVSIRKKGKRDAFLTSIIDKIESAIYAECLMYDYVYVNVVSKDGWIDVFMNRDGTNEVLVCHNDNDHESHTLEAAITAMLPDWRLIQNEAEREAEEEREFQDYLWWNCRNW